MNDKTKTLAKALAAVALLAGALGWMWSTYRSYGPISPEQAREMMQSERQARREARRQQFPAGPRQEAERAQPTPEERRQNLYRRLELTEAQRIQAEIIRVRLEQEGPVREGAFRRELSSILTEDQRAELAEIEAQRRNRQRQPSPEGT
ncbi:MAG: hypothetical protein HUU25_01130 [Candidatus Sumerlaeia bacterium]|nr:hypothetical protein [Candidatus Sumerlaeia bacterium]